MKFNERTTKSEIWIIVAVALMARILFFFLDLKNPFHLYPIIDENEFYKMAKEIAQDGLSAAGYFWHPPLYTFLLAFLIKLGFSVQEMVVIQMLAGVAGTIFLYLAIKKIYPLTALIVSIIWAVYPLQLFIETRLISENLFIFLSLLFFFLYVSFRDKPWIFYLLAALTGLMVITRTQFLIFLIIWMLFLIFYEKIPLKKLVLIFIIALVFPLMTIFHNAFHTQGKLWFISANGPVNFYIGNSNDIEKTLNIRPLEWKEKFFPDLYNEAGIYFTEKDTQRLSYPYLLSGFLLRKTINESADFQVLFNNFLQKTLILFHAHETPRNYDIYQWRKFNDYLRLTITDKPLRLPLVLFYYAALIFMFVSWKKLLKNDFLRLVLIFIFSGLLPAVIFFNAFRYRLTIVPFLLIFAVLFYLDEYKNFKLQIINILMMIFLGTGITASILVQKIPESETWRLAGDASFNKNDYEKAEAYYFKSLKLLENEADNELARVAVLKKLSNLAILTGNQGKAAEILEKAGEIKLSDAELIFAHATSLYLKGDFPKAVEEYTRAITLNNLKISPQAYHGRALCLIRMKKIKEAFQDFDSAILLKPDYAEAWSNRGILKGRQGDTPGALKDLDKAITLNPDYAKAYLNRGIAYLTINETGKALSDFNMAIDLDSLNAQAYYLRGIARINSGDKNNGCVDLNKSLRLGFKQAEADIRNNCK